jgi:arsenate reductase
MKARIYHNPRCSKSRETLALLMTNGIDVDIVEYLTQPPTRATLRLLLAKLDARPLELVRTNEPEFGPFAGRELDENAVLDLLVQHPRLLQRPIVETDSAARIGRPPERVLELWR